MVSEVMCEPGEQRTRALTRASFDGHRVPEQGVRADGNVAADHGLVPDRVPDADLDPGRRGSRQPARPTLESSTVLAPVSVVLLANGVAQLRLAHDDPVGHPGLVAELGSAVNDSEGAPVPSMTGRTSPKWWPGRNMKSSLITHPGPRTPELA